MLIQSCSSKGSTDKCILVLCTGTSFNQLILKHWTRAVHENVLPAVVNTGAATAEACQPGVSVQSCHVCHFIPARLCAWAPAMCHLQPGVCSCRLPHLLQLVESLRCVAMRAVWSVGTNHWSLMSCTRNWQYSRVSQMTRVPECAAVIIQWYAANVEFVWNKTFKNESAFLSLPVNFHFLTSLNVITGKRTSDRILSVVVMPTALQFISTSF